MEFFWKALLFSTTDTSRFTSLLNVLGYQTSSDLYHSVQSTITIHISEKLAPSLIQDSQTLLTCALDIWQYYMDAIKMAAYEALVGGIGGGLSRGLHDGLGTCGSRALQSVISEFLSINRWKSMSFFLVNQKHLWKRADWVQLGYDWWEVQYDHWKGTFGFEIDVLKWCLYFLGMCFTAIIISLYNNIILLGIKSVVTYGVEYMRLCIGIFFVVSVFLWWHADGGTLITSMDELSSQVELQSEQWRRIRLHRDNASAVDLIMQQEKDFGETELDSLRERDRGAGSRTSFGLPSHMYGSVAKQMLGSRAGTKPPRLSPRPSTSTSSSDFLRHLSVVLLSYSLGYLTNFIFAFPLTSTLCAGLVTFCVFSHMCRGVVYQVLYYLYTYYRMWNEFETARRHRSEKGGFMRGVR